LGNEWNKEIEEKSIMIFRFLRDFIRFIISVVGFIMKPLITKPSEVINKGRIAILLWGGIGNHILFSSVLYGIRKKFPDTNLTICSFHSFASQMFSDTADSFITIGENPSLRGIIKLVFYMRRYRSDVVLSNAMSPTFLSSLIAFLSGADIRIGMDRKNRGFLNNIRIPEDNDHEVQKNIRIGSALGVNAGPLPLSVDVSKQDREVAKKVVSELTAGCEDSTLIAIQPGSGEKQSFKRWSKVKFGNLTKKLLDLGFCIVVVGTEEEGEEISYIENSIVDKNLKFLKRELTLPQITIFLDYFDLIIANDTSMVHMGAVGKVPSVVIYGPTDPQKNKPWGVDFRIVRKELDCSPCYNFRIPNCPYHYKCLKDIMVEDVLDATWDILRKRK
jgi:ADP-heptose:LPS heptosyltransferase